MADGLAITQHQHCRVRSAAKGAAASARHAVTQVASTVFNFFLKAAYLVCLVLNVGLCLTLVVVAPKVCWQPAGFAPLFKGWRYSCKLRVGIESYVSEGELAVKQALAVAWLTFTPVLIVVAARNG